MLLILASPHVLSEPSGAGARPVHPIRVISLPRSNSVAFGAKLTLSRIYEYTSLVKAESHAPRFWLGRDMVILVRTSVVQA